MNNIKAEAPKIKQPKNLKIKLKEHQKSLIWAMNNLEEKGEINLKINSSVSAKGTIQLNDNSIDNESNIFGNNYWYHSWYYRNGGDFLPRKHPSAKSHKMWADWLVQNVIKQ